MDPIVTTLGRCPRPAGATCPALTDGGTPAVCRGALAAVRPGHGRPSPPPPPTRPLRSTRLCESAVPPLGANVSTSCTAIPRHETVHWYQPRTTTREDNGRPAAERRRLEPPVVHRHGGWGATRRPRQRGASPPPCASGPSACSCVRGTARKAPGGPPHKTPRGRWRRESVYDRGERERPGGELGRAPAWRGAAQRLAAEAGVGGGLSAAGGGAPPQPEPQRCRQRVEVAAEARQPPDVHGVDGSGGAGIRRARTGGPVGGRGESGCRRGGGGRFSSRDGGRCGRRPRRGLTRPYW